MQHTLTRDQYLRAAERPPIIRPVPRLKDRTGRTIAPDYYEGEVR